MKDRIIIILGILLFLGNGDNYAAAPLIINISKDLHFSVSAAALSVTSYMLAFGVFTIIFGPLSDRYGKANILKISALGTAIFSILGATAYNLPSLVFFRAVNGAFGAGIFPIAIALTGERYEGEKNRSIALGKIMSLGFIGTATATAIGGAIAYFSSWRIVYLVYGIAELIVTFIIFKWLEKDKNVTNKLNMLTSYREALKNKNVMSLLVIFAILGFTVFGSFTYSGQIITELTGYNLLIVGIILSSFGIGILISSKTTTLLKNMFPSSFSLIAGIIGALALFSISYVSSIWSIYLSFILFGMGFFFIHPTLISKIQEELKHMKGTAMSLASLCFFGGGAIGSSLDGVILDNMGISQIFVIAGFCMLTVGFLANRFFNKQTASEKVSYKLIKEVR